MTGMHGEPVLHGYFRSTAAYRVRIALNLKRIAWRDVFHHLRDGRQRAPDYLALNPQGLVPALEWNGAVLTQSLAICEFLDELVSEPPLLPGNAVARARVRAFAQVIACDTHPVQNLRVLQRLRAAGLDEAAVTAWARDTIADGLGSCDALIAGHDGPYAFGTQVTLADLCLVPQLVNARRFGVDVRWPRLLAVEAACLALPAFAKAAPERQPDAE
ncbi:maleylpyruvate isomerase [Sphingomonas sp. BE138]|nr:maleylacetoacetate isomerase [Sphingomonas sp. BE138]MDR6788060.1 maleylpyruvate isomerase [Sphingomonas sp. BE138]